MVVRCGCVVTDGRVKPVTFELTPRNEDVSAHRFVLADIRCSVGAFHRPVELNVFRQLRPLHGIKKNAVLHRNIFAAVTLIIMPGVSV
ncbi:hypothetical protein SDC9_141277 [bioreactor metagenome]|uniref:Uncharacterized protein n=1 Tax=bioreactor metagenome TaxID=1076179 RepID=A0A645DX77_9ZZZZ